MIKLPKVTVYIPVYNYGRFVERAIKSVFDQTLKDWELLVINDGSTDDTEAVLKKYESCEKVTIVNQKNKGLTVSCNIALRLARGEYFMRLDADDYLDENALLVMSHFLDEHPEYGLAYPDYYLTDEHGEVEGQFAIGALESFGDVTVYDAAHITLFIQVNELLG